MALKKSELYSSLWQSCDELRGGMDTSQYKDYVLSLLFIKYVSDKYAGQPFSPITEQPASMRLLIVVDKLLTGFDAPACTYLYIDKSMQDHGLFQAICRTNRLDGEDKDFGYIVDYKDLFRKVEKAIAVYTSELDDAGEGESSEILLQDRLTKGRERLDNAIEALDLKAYEADMRHLIDRYIEADGPRKISPFDGIGLLDLIVKTGIADAIAAKLSGMQGNKDSVAETIENNVRKKIIKEQLSDPAFYDKMSSLLSEVIADRKAKAIEYEEYLKRIAEIVKKLDAGKADDTPAKLDSPGKRAIYNQLRQSADGQGNASQIAERPPGYRDGQVDMALRIDETVKQVRPDGWRGVQAKEQVIKAALYGVLQDIDQVESVFSVLKAQGEY